MEHKRCTKFETGERKPWNKGKITGQKPPLQPKHVWAIRSKLQLQKNARDLALFMEALLWALKNGGQELARNIVDWGSELEGGTAQPFEELRLFFEDLESRGELDTYFETAQRVISPERVIFTGYLTHAQLKYLMPCCDVAIFPSVVPEAGPLVFLEALASGCFPMGTYFAGMAAHIDSVSTRLPTQDAALMRLSNDKTRTVTDIVANSQGALALAGVYKKTLRRAVEELYDWTNAARKLSAEMAALKT